MALPKRHLPREVATAGDVALPAGQGSAPVADTAAVHIPAAPAPAPTQIDDAGGKDTDAKADAQKHLDGAQKQVAAKRADAQKKAGAQKKDTEKKSGGFIGWLASKARAVVDAYKKANDAIFNALREVVKGVFEAAKKLAAGVIEAARLVITGLIVAYGAALKGILRVTLALFPKLADKYCKAIDDAVKTARAGVDATAGGLKSAVNAIVGFLASTVDKILQFAQTLTNGIYSVAGMMVSGEWKEIAGGLNNLVAAAKTAPEQFQTAAYEELLGGNLDQPLSPAELKMAGITPKVPSGQAAAAPAGGADAAKLPGPPWTDKNLGVDKVVTDMTLSPELMADIQAKMGGGDELVFGTKHLDCGVSYARTRSGARLYFRKVGDTIEVVGKSSKDNQKKVIKELQKLYG